MYLYVLPGAYLNPIFVPNLHETCENVMPKLLFNPERAKNATFRVPLSTHEFGFIFAFFFAPFLGGKQVFCLALAPGWPENTGGTTCAHFFLG